MRGVAWPPAGCWVISPVDHQLSQQLWSLPLEDLLDLSRRAQIIRHFRWCNRRCLACHFVGNESSQRQIAIKHGDLLTVLRLCACLFIWGSQQYGVGALHPCMIESHEAPTYDSMVHGHMPEQQKSRPAQSTFSALSGVETKDRHIDVCPGLSRCPWSSAKPCNELFDACKSPLPAGPVPPL